LRASSCSTRCHRCATARTWLFVAREINERGHELEHVYEYGTGTKLKTIGPNAGSCASDPATCPAGTTPKEERTIRVDGLGRMIERWEPASAQVGNVVSYTPIKVETNTYIDMPPGMQPTSMTHTALVTSSETDSQDKTELDGHGRPIKHTVYVFGTAPADQITTYHYNHDGTLKEVRVPDPSLNDASTVAYRYEFDSLGRPTSIRRPDFTTPAAQSGVNMSYDGLTTTSEEVVGADGGQAATTRTTSDAYGRLTTVEEKLDATSWATTTYQYGPDDNVSTIIGPAPDHVTTSLVHDFAGRRVEITRNNRTWKYGYDKNGNMISIRSPTPCAPQNYCDLSYTTTIAYDALDRPSSKLPAPRDLSPEDIALFGLHHETFLWDHGAVGHHGNYKGRLIYWRAYGSATAIANQTNRNHNAQGNVTSGHEWFNSAGYSLSRELLRAYAPSGLHTYSHYRDFVGSSTGYTTSITTYDRRGLPSFITLTRAFSGGQQVVAKQSRNVAGLVTKRFNKVDSVMAFVESNWVYDRLGRVKSQVVQKGPGPTQVAKQELDYFGNDDPKSLDHWLGDSNHKQFVFSYDLRHQLTGVAETELPNAFSATYEFGRAGRFHRALVNAAALPNGNVAPRDVTYAYEGADPEQVTALVQTNSPLEVYASYAYDEAGNQTIRCNGVLTGTSCTGESMRYVYDGKDQLRRATKKDSQGTTLAIEEYWYNDDNQRVVTVKRDGNGDKTGMILWTGDIEAHYDGAGTATRVYSHISLGTPVARIDRTSSTVAPLEYQFHGLASNTLAAVSETGTINASFTYAPFGEIIEATDAGAPFAGLDKHRRRMNDKYVDEVSELAYYGFRYYDRTSMTWTQSDPLYRFAPDAAWIEPRHASLYTMTLNNPLRYQDPDGRQAAATLGGLVAAGGESALLGLAEATGIGGLVALPLAAATLRLAQANPDAPGISVKHEAAYDQAVFEKARKESAERVDRTVREQESNVPAEQAEEPGIRSASSARTSSGDSSGGPMARPDPVEASKVAKTPSGKRVEDFTPGQKKAAKATNKQKNGGRMRCENPNCRRPLRNVKNKKGKKTPADQAQVHHDPAIVNGGTRATSTPKVLCPECHRAQPH
jgi:RHS repeat-associated protein